jgi:hypothetical protein
MNSEAEADRSSGPPIVLSSDEDSSSNVLDSMPTLLGCRESGDNQLQSRGMSHSTRGSLNTPSPIAELSVVDDINFSMEDIMADWLAASPSCFASPAAY